MRIRFLLLLMIALCSGLHAAEDDVRVDGGLISGTTDNGARCFKAVPYAAPPIGDLRWQAPQPVVPWQGVRACDSDGPVCPQLPYPSGSVYEAPVWEQDEDCLTLNIWTRAKNDDKLPVMVWIHGGAWTRGSGSRPVYGGASLSKRGVVVVTINYRLGPFGFLAHPELTAESKNNTSGNQGIMDQLAALQWVQRNISQFGGDPDNVTIFGESAGSWSVHVLTATPRARGLFHKAIGQSGSRFGPAPHLKQSATKLPSAHEAGIAFMKACGADSLQQLREMPAADILKTRFRTQLTIDGYLFPDSIARIYAEGKQNRVAVLAGSNADEMTALTNPKNIPRTLEDATKAIAIKVGAKNVPRFRDEYQLTDQQSIRKAMLNFSGDSAFALGMRRWMRETDRAGLKSYLYYFTYVPPGPLSEMLGAYHAGEVQYVFDNLDKSDDDLTDADHDLANTIAGYWTNFARTGSPNGEGLPHWPEFNVDDEGYLELGGTVSAKQHLLKSRLDFLESLHAAP